MMLFSDESAVREVARAIHYDLKQLRIELTYEIALKLFDDNFDLASLIKRQLR